jgi:hypothetical protein
MGAIGYGRGKAAALRRAVHERLLVHERDGELPTSSRFVFYELRQAGALAIRPRGPGHGSDPDLADAVMWLRDRGLIPWHWIIDETRSVVAYASGASVAEHLQHALASARINPWGGPPPLIICESRTFAGVLARTLARDYLCPVAATNGQRSQPSSAA